MPEYFYKYKAIDPEHPEWVREIFTHSKIYFAHYSQFNDPFDMQWHPTFDAPVRKQRAHLRKIIKQRHPTWNRPRVSREISEQLPLLKSPEHIEQAHEARDWMTDRQGILSLSRVHDDLLMWGHYGGSHKGICIQFLDDRHGGFMKGAHEVIYAKEYPVLNAVLDDPNEFAQRALLSKSKHWCYEQEWRMVTSDGRGAYEFPPHLLTGVIFGCRTSPEDEALVREWCKGRDPQPKFYRMHAAEQEYKLEMEEV